MSKIKVKYYKELASAVGANNYQQIRIAYQKAIDAGCVMYGIECAEDLFDDKGGALSTFSEYRVARAVMLGQRKQPPEHYYGKYVLDFDGIKVDLAKHLYPRDFEPFVDKVFEYPCFCVSVQRMRKHFETTTLAFYIVAAEDAWHAEKIVTYLVDFRLQIKVVKRFTDCSPVDGVLFSYEYGTNQDWSYLFEKARREQNFSI